MIKSVGVHQFQMFESFESNIHFHSLVHWNDPVLFFQGRTHTLKPGVKDPVPALSKGPPPQPLEDLSMRIYLCEGLLGTFSPPLPSQLCQSMCDCIFIPPFTHSLTFSVTVHCSDFSASLFLTILKCIFHEGKESFALVFLRIWPHWTFDYFILEEKSQTCDDREVV